jgi:hypothetical protein
LDRRTRRRGSACRAASAPIGGPDRSSAPARCHCSRRRNRRSFFDLRNPIHAGLIKDPISRIACEVEREGDVIGGQNVAIMKLDAVSNLEFTREIVDLLPRCREQRLELERSAVAIDQRVIDPKAQEKAFAPGRIISIRLCGAWWNAAWIVSSDFPAKAGDPRAADSASAQAN